MCDYVRNKRAFSGEPRLFFTTSYRMNEGIPPTIVNEQDIDETVREFTFRNWDKDPKS